MIFEYVNKETGDVIYTVYDGDVMPRVDDHVWLDGAEWIVRCVVLTPKGFMVGSVFVELLDDMDDCLYYLRRKE